SFLAASRGHLAALQWLHARSGCPLSSLALRTAVSGGHLHVADWLLEAQEGHQQGGQRRLSPSLLARVAGSGDMRAVRWVHERLAAAGDGDVVRPEEDALVRGAQGGCEEVLEWLVEQGCPWGESGRPYQSAAQQGDMATLRCLRRLGCPWGPSRDTFTACVRLRARLPVLRWLLQEGCPVDWGAATGAALGRQEYEDEQAWLREQQ
ncbi:hypothetical protein Agub_g10253, partial [Astrephomene gubernaculifera]